MPSSTSPSAARESPSVLSARGLDRRVAAALGHRAAPPARPSAAVREAPAQHQRRARGARAAGRAAGSSPVGQQLHRARRRRRSPPRSRRPSAGSGRAARSRNAARSGIGLRVDLGDRLAHERERARRLAGVRRPPRRRGAARRRGRSPRAPAASGTRSHSSSARSKWRCASRNASTRLDGQPGRDRAAERARDVVRGVPVAGEHRRRRRRPGASPSSSGRASTASASRACSALRSPGQQVAVDRLADERVAERVRLARRRSRAPGGRRPRAARAAAPARRASRQRGEQRVAHRVLDR